MNENKIGIPHYISSSAQNASFVSYYQVFENMSEY